MAKETNKEKYSKLSRSGAARFRGDKKAAKVVFKMVESKTVVLTKYARSLLFPWSTRKLKYVLQRPVDSLEEGYRDILNLEIPSQTYITLFQQSAIFKRIADTNYTKKNG